MALPFWHVLISRWWLWCRQQTWWGYFHQEAQNLKGCKELLEVIQSSLPAQAGSQKQVTQPFVQMFFEYLWKRWLHNLSWQPVQGLSHLHSKVIFHIQVELPMLKFLSAASHLLLSSTDKAESTGWDNNSLKANSSEIKPHGNSSDINNKSIQKRRSCSHLCLPLSEPCLRGAGRDGWQWQRDRVCSVCSSTTAGNCPEGEREQTVALPVCTHPFLSP